jgi:NAD(P)-dependent dehydrogenase (short-subunit alcohol dehydrogenase family)
VTPLDRIAYTEWAEVIATNLDGPFLCSQRIAQSMIANGTRGRIVNISSTAGTVARPGIAHYATSKAGLDMLTRSLAVELAPAGITVNAVCPGVIATRPLLEQAEANPAANQAKMDRIPLGRLGLPEEVASAVLFLISPEAAYITGACLFVDGGYSLGIAAPSVQQA